MDLDDLLTQFSPDVRERITIHGHKDMRATIASGSNPTGGMIITPCSMGTLCSIASGLSGNLIERAAAVCLKERRPLVLMARESPLSTIHLEQMAAVSRAGAVLFPPMPALYLKPQSIEQMVTQIIARALTHMGIENSDIQGWNYETY
jgi:polyprenyl P-hydroxybenzoate/phenylacrylic acid decarboxylase-like protein